MARSFNGSSDQISCGTGVPNPTTAVSWGGWVKFTALTNAYSALGFRTDGVGQNTYIIYVKSTGKLAVFVDNTSYDGTGTNTLTTGTWYHLFATYSVASGIIGYVNGAVDKTVAGVANVISSTLVATIGYDSGTSGRIVAGSIAEMAQWSNVVLTAGEVSALANGALPNTIRPGALTGYWPLNGLQSPEPDYSGNRNNGTLTGTALAAGPPVMMFTPRWPQNIVGAAASAGGVRFRRALSELGTRTGSRQRQAA